MLTSGRITLCVDARILLEYEDVLRRPCFKIDPLKSGVLLEYISCHSQTPAVVPLVAPLPDPDDQPFLEVALSSRAVFLITGNIRHFPSRWRHGVQVVSPREFLASWNTVEKE